jgi:hypothetical protein
VSKANAANEIDSKVADFEEGRISLAELESFLERVETSQLLRVSQWKTGRSLPPDKA